jgi:hypothetical protein
VKERAYRKPLERATKRLLQDDPDYEPLFSRPDSANFRFAAYLRALIAGDPELKESSRESYEISIRNHFDGTRLGNTDIRDVTADDVVEFWASVGSGHRRVWQLMSQGFNNAVRRGHRESSPLPRTGIKPPSKARVKEIEVLSVDQ